ncbi:hypothetical protein COW36_19685 [bacterium (Candidatus Blackallbacteria) CG17_big_fil_post_rev_8_21_14_2_50_48_46]|uniref:PhoU domain-containing protein n=1 Tax=bacterium (Candidatus Blackallbacteria) CG17_big_fil_post_rev_8_21_14_2_50_48_46 TaxID=2014261 RepID=A0A2M7FZN4_9BACT|nr:MAG: hypothetical protein COW64_15610 [bacterium (Candidatus Blackallbacteria) CG18_big_fil_WC_8_21_14_2_50_49_26]PIW14875.1 MAG: hypothetical protein COW36_19685 [bacterium (Candidatus Blackallbacteria) CG17_big_fil_post_rev_8_21_14_2_50_48_46]PIW44442.1 MAG: hypothetical protein COW20_24260 [bacterium (Candidatus Blackallbacteria) CG13_big_fil_rev_8_21_14_2_50_49_14]
MNYSQFLQSLTGLGIFLFSLRFLSEALGDSLNRMLRPWLSKVLARPLNCFLSGLGITALVQASSITVIAAMGLLNTYVISLEQGYMIVLGASLGTTLKAWFYTRLVENHAGALLVGVCSIALLFIHKKNLRIKLEIAMAIGFAFLGLQMLTAALASYSSQFPVISYFTHQSSLGISGQALAVVAGLILALMVQSSSTVVFLILHLATQGLIDYPSGVALILGANLGTSFQPFLAAIEYGKSVRRLAMSYFLVKAGGVFLILLLFSLFLIGVDRLIPGVPSAELVFHLAGAHFFYNFFTVLAGYLLMPFVLRFVYLVIPGQGKQQDFFLNPVVRRMLRQSPDKSLFEVNDQLQKLLQLTMGISDQILLSLTQKEPEAPLLGEQGSRFFSIQEGIYEILVPLSRQELPAVKHQRTEILLEQLQACSKLHHHCQDFYVALHEGLFVHAYRLPDEMRDLMPEFHTHYHQLWLRFFKGQEPEPLLSELRDICLRLDERFLTFQLEDHFEAGYYAWLHQSLAELWHLLHLTSELFTEHPELPVI